MAQRGKPIPAYLVKAIQKFVKQYNNISGAARRNGVARNTVKKYTRPSKPLS